MKNLNYKKLNNSLKELSLIIKNAIAGKGLRELTDEEYKNMINPCQKVKYCCPRGLFWSYEAATVD